MLLRLLSNSSSTIIIEDNDITIANNQAIELLQQIFSPKFNPQLKKTGNILKDFLKCPDFYYISSSSLDKNSIPIENIREIIAKLKFSTIQNPKKSLFIENGKDLSIESQTTLLKTLEEPPKDTFIIISIENRNQLLPTVLSRSIIYSSNNLNTSNIIYKLPERIEQAFLEVEKISTISDLKRKREKAYQFMDALIDKATTLPNTQKYQTLRNLLYIRNTIAKNANLRLALENGIIELYS